MNQTEAQALLRAAILAEKKANDEARIVWDSVNASPALRLETHRKSWAATRALQAAMGRIKQTEN